MAAAIAWMITMLIGFGFNILNNAARNKIQAYANELSKALSKNSDLQNELLEAYSNKDARLMNQLLTGAGFGPRTESIVQQIKTNKKSYTSKKAELNKKRDEIQDELNRTTNDYNSANNPVTSTRVLATTYGNKDSGKEGTNIGATKQNIEGGFSE